MEIKKLNKNNFDEIVFEEEKLVLIDFYADWCGPCKMLSPVIEELAATTNIDLVIGKVDVESEADIARKFNVYSIPTLMLVKNKEVIKIETGYKSKQLLEEFIKV